MKNSDIFLILPQNIDRGHTLEPPQYNTARFHGLKKW